MSHGHLVSPMSWEAHELCPLDGNAAGDVIAGRYELIDPLGAGGMGTVWCARDHVLAADVAIKLVRPRTDEPQLVDRLLREARAAARVPHPAIVRVLDFGRWAKGAYIAMEMLHGAALDEVLEERRYLPPAEAVKLLLPIVHAVHAAHLRGVIHRDIKPPNIFVSHGEDGQVMPKLLDFGIARTDALPFGGRLTATGEVLGTPHYMAPEQASGRRDIDHRIDIWALAAVLYELLEGEPPFDGENYNAVISSVLMREPAEPSAPGIDAGLRRILVRGLCKDRDQRYGSAGELARDLASWLRGRCEHADISGRLIAKGVAQGRTGRSGPVSSQNASDPTVRAGVRRSWRWLVTVVTWLAVLALVLVATAASPPAPARLEPALTAGAHPTEQLQQAGLLVRAQAGIESRRASRARGDLVEAAPPPVLRRRADLPLPATPGF